MTYSIVARDSATGRLGVAVQSHALHVGRIVPWAEAGVGAVATQAKSNLSLGPIGLELLRSGRSAEETVASLVASDPNIAQRQVAVVDVVGRSAAFTGEACIPVAGHRPGDGFTVQGNMLERETCLERMASTYTAASAVGESFSERLLRALEAAEAEGGDVRGQQSAAILVVEAEVQASPWRGVVLDIRIVDHPDPVPELRRLVRLVESYALLDEDADAARSGRGRMDLYREARTRAPEAVGLAFRIGVELANAGDVDGARRELAVAFRADPRWRTTLERYGAAGRLSDPSLVPLLLKARDDAPGD